MGRSVVINHWGGCVECSEDKRWVCSVPYNGSVAYLIIGVKTTYGMMSLVYM